MMSEENKTKTYIYAIIVISMFILVAVGTSIAAYYLVVGNDNTAPIKVKTAYAVATYNAKNDINVTNIMPGWSDEIKFVITNISKEDNTVGNYNLFLEVEKNEINSNSFVYSISGKSYENKVEIGEDANNILINSNGDKIVPTASVSLGKGSINTNVSHEYTIKFRFKENGNVQNDLQGKTFKAKIYAKGEPDVSEVGESNE